MKTKAFLLLCLFIGIGMTQLTAQNSDQNSPAVATHSITITLKPDVTVNQYIDFMNKKYIPEYEKNFPGSKMDASKNFITDKENQYFVRVIFESLKARDKYYMRGSGTSNKTKLAWGKMDLITSEASKYIWDSIRINNDWVVALDEVAVK
jgi:hypothetical protein